MKIAKVLTGELFTISKMSVFTALSIALSCLPLWLKHLMCLFSFLFASMWTRYKIDAPVFAVLPDAVGGYAVHDPRLILKENTLAKPLADGGGSAVLRSAVRSRNGHKLNVVVNGGKATQFELREDESVVLCAAALPSFLNEGQCKLSDEADACFQPSAQDGLDEVRVVVTLDSATLSALYDITSRFVYAIDGLAFDNTNVPRSGTPLVDLPCSGSSNPRSRWIPVSKSQKDCVSNLHSISRDALAAALANSNDDNLVMRDIHMWEADDARCHADDVYAHGMFIYVPSERTCWQNVHPDRKYGFSMWRLRGFL